MPQFQIYWSQPLQCYRNRDLKHHYEMSQQLDKKVDTENQHA